MTTPLRIGFLPLVDAALLVAAREQGFAEEQGLAIELVRDVSWANLRDRLSVGLLDAAHMLAPAAIAATLGLGHLRVPMAAPIALNMNGNAITVSRALFAEMVMAADGDLGDVNVAARAFAGAAAQRAAHGAEAPVLASVFPFSSHMLLLSEFLRRAGLKAGSDVPIVVLPPQLMAASLANGQIDGFCAGAPWNAYAVEAGLGAIAALGLDLIAGSVVKLLVLRAADLDSNLETALALVRAVLAAAKWAGSEGNRRRLALHLSTAAYLDAPAAMIESVLAGRIDPGAGRTEWSVPDYLRIDPDALAPSEAAADRLLDEMIAAGQMSEEADSRQRARRVFRGRSFSGCVSSPVTKSRFSA